MRILGITVLLGAAALATGPALAATPLPLTPPPPALAPLVPFAEAPLDKPPIIVPIPALPAAPDDLPVLPPASLAFPSAPKPTAPIPAPRALPCAGTWLGVATESLECGRSRFQKGEYDEAAKAFESAVRASDREVVQEARYWLGESYYRIGRIEPADKLFRQVSQEGARGELGVWSLHSSGWTALRLGDAARARDVFTQVLGGTVPAPIAGWARHGLGLANYGLGRWMEARQAWEPLAASAPAELQRDVRFWYGDTLGRLGEHAKAEAELSRFVQGGLHPLLMAGQLRRGWWALAAGKYPQSVAVLREYFALAGRPAATRGSVPPDADWAEAGLALASLGAGDIEGARRGLQALQSRRSALATPVVLRLARASLEQKRPAEARALAQDALGASLSPPVRAWTLMVDGEAARMDGNRDDARTQLDLARQAQPTGPIGWQAALRVAQANIEMREFAQAVTDLAPVLADPAAPPEIRALALILQSEAAYQAGDRAAAITGFRRALVEFPKDPQAPLVQLGVAWSALKLGKVDEARREFLTFVSNHPNNPHAADALVLASEMALSAGDWVTARPLLDRVITNYPTQPRTDLARLNRGILMGRTGQSQSAVPALRDWLGRGSFPPLVGRAHVALGVALLDTRNVPEASREFTLAKREGLGPVASLGLGSAALAERRWDDATRDFGEARDTGTTNVAAAAEYGLAVVAFQRGSMSEFKKIAQAALAAPATQTGRRASLLYVLTGIAVEEKDWAAALANAKRLADEYPSDEAADDAFERVGSGAASARNWALVLDAYTLLAERYPKSPFVPDSRGPIGEALAGLGRGDEARPNLEAFLQGSPTGPRATGAWVALARLRDASGDRAGALDAYTRAGRGAEGTDWAPEALRGYAKLLTEDRRWDQARSVLGPALKGADGEAAVEIAAAIGDTYRGEGDQLAATEYYMTAAYLAPQSAAGRDAMLAAARSFATLKQPDAAALVYRKLLALPDLPADMASSARQELATLGR